MPTTYWLKFGNTPLGYNGNALKFTHVEPPAQLTVRVAVSGSGSGTTSGAAELAQIPSNWK